MIRLRPHPLLFLRPPPSLPPLGSCRLESRAIRSPRVERHFRGDRHRREVTFGFAPPDRRPPRFRFRVMDAEDSN